MKLNDLYEETTIGIGLKTAWGLGKTIAKAMRMKAYDAKRRQRRKKSLIGSGPGVPELRKTKGGSGVLTSPVIKNPRYRKYFGLNNPGTPY